jgi:thioredoxin-related protein
MFATIGRKSKYYGDMRKLSLALCAVALLAGSAFAADDARVMIDKARAAAAKENKNVLVIFHASWCGWCKRFERVMALPDVKPLFEKAYVIVPLTVMESPEFKANENPNGMEVLKELEGDMQGIPFFAAVGKDGKMIMNSRMPVEGKPSANVGCPASDEEIAYFMKFLQKTAPMIDQAERDLIAKRLKEAK